MQYTFTVLNVEGKNIFKSLHCEMTSIVYQDKALTV